MLQDIGKTNKIIEVKYWETWNICSQEEVWVFTYFPVFGTDNLFYFYLLFGTILTITDFSVNNMKNACHFFVIEFISDTTNIVI